MLLRLVSPEFDFESGDAAVVMLRAQNAWPLSLGGFSLQSNAIHCEAIREPGEITILVHDCDVRSKTSGALRRVQAFSLGGSIPAEALAAAVAEIPVPHHAFARIQVLDEDRRPLAGAGIGIVLEHSTVEMRMNTEGQVDCLLTPGEHVAYLLDEPGRIHVLTVGDREEDAVLTVVRSARP